MSGRNPQQRQRNRNQNRNHGRREHQQESRGNESRKRQLAPCPSGLTKENMQAISAPYNFVPLADWVHIPEWSDQVSHDWPFKDGYSGEIHYRLIAESPLLVGGKQKKATNQQPGEVHPFQLTDGRYAIPGSSLKGMLRTVVEIAGFGRMRMVDDVRSGLRDITGKHVKDAYIQRVRDKICTGFLRQRRDGGAEIVPCRMARLPLDQLEDDLDLEGLVFKTGASVREKYQRWRELCREKNWDPEVLYFDLQDGMVTKLGTGSTKGFPVFTGQIKGKKKDFVFFTPDPDRRFSVSDADWRDFLAIHGNDKAGKEGLGLSWPGYWKEIYHEGGEVPVFYLEDGMRVRIGLAYMPKLAGDFSTHDCIRHACEDHLDREPAPGCYDFADLLFGAIHSKQQNAALRGRVSVETALAIGNPQVNVEESTILNGPKPSYFPNYVVQEVDESGMGLAGGENAQYATYVRSHQNKKPRIRGFKRYPARPSNMTRVQTLTEEQKANKKVQIRLHTLPRGTAFEGRILFHNLKREELGALLWALAWGGDNGLHHGLGMGKPFGFGQVRFEIDENKSCALSNNAYSEETLSREKQQEFMDAFENHMEQAAREHGGWKESIQIRNLLAMADPEAARNLPKDMKLRHMRILRCLRNGRRVNANEFVWAEQKALVLADYADATGWPGETTKKRWQAAQSRQVERELASSDIHPWLQEQLKEVLTESNAVDLDALMRHNKLFRKWKAIEDTKLKKEVFEVIRSFWENKGWWQNPVNNSMRQLRGKYEREARKP